MSVKLDNLKQTSNTKNEYNILVLGETGHGKSTTINALASYLKYSSFEDACAAKEFINLIPTKFRLSDVNRVDTFLVTHGNDPNELLDDKGASRTQTPKGHVFRSKDKLIRIIDTPGMGDTGGIDKDKEHFDQILNFIARFDYLHGICIIVKSTESKLTAMFNYCLSELFLHLHKDACRNVIFCFTNSSPSSYSSADGLSTVQDYLESELPNLKLKKNVNVFFIENESYRLLLARQKGFNVDAERLKYGKDCWEKSAKQIQIMIDQIIDLEPHEIIKTKLLGDTKKMLLSLAEPLVRLQTSTTENERLIKAEEDRLKNCPPDKIEQVMQNYSLKLKGLKRKNQTFPTTVCTDDKCVEVIIIDGEYEINYTKRCHEHCNLTDVETNAIGHPELKDCSAMVRRTFCGKCRCSWEKHQHIRYKIIEPKNYVDFSESSAEKTQEMRLSSVLGKLKILEKEYSNELAAIKDSPAKFAYILATYSNWPINKFTEPYIDLLITKEKRIMNRSINASRAKYDLLVEMSHDHSEMVDKLKKAIQNKTREIVRIEDIEQIKNKLIRLKHTGGQFKQLIEDNITAKARKFEFVEDLGLDLSNLNL